MPDRGILQLILMAKKGNKKPKPVKQASTGGDPEKFSLDIPEEGAQAESKPVAEDPGTGKAAKKPGQKPSLSTDQLKWAAVILLVALVIVLAVFFLDSAKNDFVPGQEMTADQFKDALIMAKNVYVLMDVRGNDSVRGSIMQCGVDFSGSTYLGSKNVVPLSFAVNSSGGSECTTANGTRTIAQCASKLDDGITIDIRPGQPAVRYFSNGMIVTMGSEYKVGTCGIKINSSN
jgi:hypothetical protein